MTDNLGFSPRNGEQISTFEADGVHTLAVAGPPAVEERLYAAVSRTATPTAPTVATRGRTSCHVVIHVSAVTDTPSVTPTIEAHDSLSGQWYPLLIGSAITATGTTVLKVGPGLTPVSGGCSADILTGLVRVTMTHADTDAITYTGSMHLMGG